VSVGTILAGASITGAAFAVFGLSRAAPLQAVVAERTPAPPPRAIPAPNPDAARARGAFAVFGTTPAGTPRLLKRIIRDGRFQQHTDPRLARAATFPDGTMAFVLSNATSICFGSLDQSGRGGGGCTTTQQELDKLATGHLGGSITKAPHGYRVTAFVPDGTTNARLTVGHTTRRLPIVDNIVSATASRRPRSLTWTAPDGTATGSPALDLYAQG
jgi:hypothetical protein